MPGYAFQCLVKGYACLCLAMLIECLGFPAIVPDYACQCVWYAVSVICKICQKMPMCDCLQILYNVLYNVRKEIKCSGDFESSWY